VKQVITGERRRIGDDFRHQRRAALLEIVHLRLPRARRDVRAERHRPDIARPGIGADQIRLAIAADAEAAGLDRRKTEMPVRANDPQRVAGRTSVLN